MTCVQSTSRVRNWVLEGKMHYKVGGLDAEMDNDNWLYKLQTEATGELSMSQGGWTGDGGKRPQNDTRKKGIVKNECFS